MGHSNRSESTKFQKKLTYIKKYGVENPSQSEEVKEKKKKTCMENWGESHHMKSDKGLSSYKKKLSYNKQCSSNN